LKYTATLKAGLGVTQG